MSMVFRKISDYPSLPDVQDDDLVLIGSGDNTYTVKGSAFKAFVAAISSQAVTAANDAQAAAAEAALAATSVDPAMFLSLIAGKGDNLEFDADEGKLYLTSGGERISDGITVITQGGGSGSGSSNNAVLTLKNTSGWIYKTVASGASCQITLEWSSLEDELSTGPGVLKITVNGTQKYLAAAEQGEVSMDIGSMLSAGSNAVKCNITDTYGNSRTVSLNITVVALSLSSPFDNTVPYSGTFDYPYVPTGAATKTVHFKVDDTELPTATVTASGRQQTQAIPAQSHGSHTLEVWFEAEVDGVTVPSNHLRHALICLEEGETDPIIAADFYQTEAEQFSSIVIPWRAYVPNSLTADVILAANGVTVSEQTVDRTTQTWTYRADSAGPLSLSITCGSVTKILELTIAESQIDVEAETQNLALFLSSYGRSNNEAQPATWVSGDVAATFENFNFVSDGWITDAEGITALRVSGDARLTIPYKIFAQDFRITGKTIEIEFASRNVLNYDAVLLSCKSGGRGLEITAQQAYLTSQECRTGTRYKEDEHIRLAFVVEKKSGNRLIRCYINGSIADMIQYPEDDDFSQGSAVDISIGSGDCTIDLYNIRVYDNDLIRYQVLDNWIADTQLGSEKNARWQRNRIYDEYGQIVKENLPKDLPYLVLACPVLPAFKGDKKTCSGYYVDPVHTERSFRFENAEIDVQGTSSQYYYIKNFKIKFKGGFILTSGSTVEVYQLGDAVPTDTYTFKADVASSEGANNVVLAKLYNELCPVATPPMEADPRVRQTIDGYPIVIFWDSGDGPKFAGKYNFNHDKGTEEVFGFSSGDESWEIRENGTDRVGFKSADYSDSSWQTEFEARYPDKNTDISRFAQFAAWVCSTDPNQATGEALAAAVTYDEVEYTADTAAYRLAKFAGELADWADVDALLFYYLFTLVFLCMDQREKNAFPTRFEDAGKWLVLFYDADSSLGTDNQGDLSLEYWMEDIDQTAGGEPVFNGQGSVLWSNIRKTHWTELEAMYQHLRTTLRTDGSGKPLLSYDVVDGMFEAHQDKWPEAIFNEDAEKKGVEPLEVEGAAVYLPMQKGKKEQHRKWWLYNRFRYMDSLFETGTSKETQITLRAHTQGNITMTSYVNMYGHVYYNDADACFRMFRGVAQEFPWAASGAEDAVIGINDADMITSLGDLSPLQLETINIAKASHLTYLKVGDAAEDYVNNHLVSVTAGTNPLLRLFDARNCAVLTASVDLSGCTNIEEVYLTGTATAGVKLPRGGNLKKLHLPGTVTNLTLLEQQALTEFILPSYSQIETLRLENVADIIPDRAIFSAVPANSRVRLIGFDWTFDSAADILTFYDRLDTMRGLDENGNNTDKAQMSGTVRVNSITGAQLAEMQSRYPNIKVVYQSIVSYLYFYNEDGTSVLQIVECKDGADGAYSGTTPTKASTAQYTYTFAGWSRTIGGAVDPDAMKNVTADRSLYAAFTATVRKYTVTWYNGSTLLEADTNVPYGTVPTYNGAEPVDAANGQPFAGWTPAVGAITGDTTYTAQFAAPYEFAEITDSWETIIANIENGTYASVYKLGNYKPLDLGTEGVVNMEIMDIDAGFQTTSGEYAPITFMAKDLLATSVAMGAESADDWTLSGVYNHFQNVVKPLLPEAVLSHLVSYATANADLWIPTVDEIRLSSLVEKYGVSTNNVYYAYFDWTGKCKAGTTTKSEWVARRVKTYGGTKYYTSVNHKSEGYANLTSKYGVCLCFCLGKNN